MKAKLEFEFADVAELNQFAEKLKALDAPPPPPPPPPATGFPDASTTGVPTGVSLNSRSGFVTTAAGQIIDAVSVAGIIQVRHRNVTIKRSRINNIWAGHDGDAAGLIVEDSEIIGGSWNSGISIVNARGAMIRRNEFRGVENGVWLEGADVTIRDNWMHDFEVGGGAHSDGVQVVGASNGLIEHNNFDLGSGGMNACIFCKDGTNSNIRIMGNRIDGGTYTIYFEPATSGCLVDGNQFVSYTYGWIGGATAGNQTYRNNVDASGKALALP